MKLQIKKGKDLSSEVIKRWNKIMGKAFSEELSLDVGKRKLFSKDLFFILYVRGEIVSVGRLRPVKMTLDGEVYDIIGIADIVSLVERKGYGRKIMDAIMKYFDSEKLTGIGFCNPKNTRFYEKCGFGILKDYVERFVCLDEKGKEHKNKWDKDIFYYSGKDNFIEKLLKTRQIVYIDIPFW